MKKYWAKSSPAETIQEHTDNLLVNYRLLKETYPGLNMNWDMLYLVCLYHDLGKMNLKFQNKIINRKYDNTEIDYFALYNIESNLLLLFPVDKPRASITFTYPFVYCKTASSNRNWEDYTIDKIIGRVTQTGEEDGLLNR